MTIGINTIVISIMKYDLVSIIMLSKNRGPYVRESINSVLAQTYQNWELIFMDDFSKDDTILQMMELKGYDRRFKVSKSVENRGSAVSMNSALRDARGRWIAFLNVGDLWEPTKLESQIAFMEEHGYAYTYTKFELIDKDSNSKGIIMGGKEQVAAVGLGI